jgi:hypothetical protein
MTIRDTEDLTTFQHITLLIQYLDVLQKGRAKPDSSGKGGWIKESVYNIKEIDEVKDRINDFFRINNLPDTIEFSTAIKKQRTWK